MEMNNRFKPTINVIVQNSEQKEGMKKAIEAKGMEYISNVSDSYPNDIVYRLDPINNLVSCIPSLMVLENSEISLMSFNKFKQETTIYQLQNNAEIHLGYITQSTEPEFRIDGEEAPWNFRGTVLREGDYIECDPLGNIIDVAKSIENDENIFVYDHRYETIINGYSIKGSQNITDLIENDLLNIQAKDAISENYRALEKREARFYLEENRITGLDCIVDFIKEGILDPEEMLNLASTMHLRDQCIYNEDLPGIYFNFRESPELHILDKEGNWVMMNLDDPKAIDMIIEMTDDILKSEKDIEATIENIESLDYENQMAI